MNKINLKAEIFSWLILLVPFIYLAIVWNQLPAEVPIHFNAEGEANGWGGKAMELLMPAINIGVYLLVLFLPLIDPKRMNYESFGSMFFKIRQAMNICFSALSILVIYSGIPQHGPFDGKWITGSVFLLLAVVGNYMINIKPNWFIGFRTPWTLSSDVVWKKTHLLGGRIFFYGGLTCFALIFVIPLHWMSHLLVPFILSAALFPVLYSYVLYKLEERKSEKEL